MSESDQLEKRTVTLLLDKARDGDSDATAQVWNQMWAEIHGIARGFARREKDKVLLQPSMLISEAYLRLFGGAIPEWKDRKHFLNTVARTMGRFLIDHAEKHGALKRGGDWKSVPLTIAVGELADFNTAHTKEASHALEALDVLERESPEAAEIVQLRFILGLSVEQTADAMGIAPRTVIKKWKYGQARLRQLLAHQGVEVLSDPDQSDD